MENKLRFRLQLAVAITFIALAAITATTSLDAQPNAVEIAYQGELLDAQRKPVAGVYPLEFRLYNDRDSDRSLWRETHWVAVVDGRYNVRLGSETKLRKTLARPGARMYLGINLVDGGELLREPIAFPEAGGGAEEADEADEPAAETPAEAPAEPAAAANTGSATPPIAKGDGGVGAQYKTESSFAELAEYAKRAGKAEDADKLGGKTRAELEAEIEKLREELSRHRTDEEAHGGGGGGSVGSQTTVLPSVGGRGGQPYNRQCPPGYVVTGIRGAAGALIDSFQVICSPLE